MIYQNDARRFMKTIGQLVQEAIDLSERDLYEMAFSPVCAAISQTAHKAFEKDAALEPAHQKFINQNWRLISFMGIPQMESSLPLNLPFRLRRAIPSFNAPNVIQELLVFTVRQTLATRRLPLEVGFNNIAVFAVENDKLLLPQSLFFALLGSVVLHPANKSETIPDKYWIHIWDFKMFISELWGRADLAERVMKIYLKS